MDIFTWHCHVTGCVIREQLVPLVASCKLASYVKALSRHPHEVLVVYSLTKKVRQLLRPQPLAAGAMLCSAVCRRCCTGDPSHKKDSAWAWIVCFAAATNLAFSSGLVYSFGVLLPVFMNYFKESRETTGKQLNSETTLGTACGYTSAFNTQRYMLVYWLPLRN